MGATPDEPRLDPYAPPAAEIGPSTEGVDREAEDFRRAFLRQEAAVKAVGLLDYVLAAFWAPAVVGSALATLGVIAPPWRRGGDLDSAARLELAGAMLFHINCFVLLVAVGRGLRGLRPWARRVEAALMGITLIGAIAWASYAAATRLIPVNFAFAASLALPAALVAFLLLSPETAVVFSDAYRSAIARTPHLRPGALPQILLLIALGLVSWAPMLIVGLLVQIARS
jgi:hypothetical protein